MPQLSDSQLSELEKTLNSLKRQLEEQLGINQESSGTVTLDQSRVGRLSRVDALQQQQMAISTRHHNKERLRLVHRALADLSAGEYGYCAKCDEEIAYQRLLAKPESKFCITCQQSIDAQ